MIWVAPNLFVLGIIAVLVGYLVSAVVAWYPLRGIPGPFLASFSYLWIFRTEKTGRSAYIHRALHDRYGSLVRIGPSELATDDPEFARMMGATSGSYTKSGWYLTMAGDPANPSMVNMLDTEQHDTLKSKLMAAYGNHDIASLESSVDAEVIELKQILQRKMERNDFCVADLARLLDSLAMDVITRAATGTELGFLKSEADAAEFLQTFWRLVPVTPALVNMPLLRPILLSRPLMSLAPKMMLGPIMHLAGDAVDQRLAMGKALEGDILSSFVDLGFGRDKCVAETTLAITAGYEGPASAMRITLLYVLSNPRVYRKLKDAVAEAILGGGVSRPIRPAEAKRIPYLQAVIYEGLRMRPPIGSNPFSKIVPKDGQEINGKFIPGGTVIQLTQMAMTRSKKLWTEPDCFRPERFLEVDEPTRAAMERTVELVFGYGRWQCAGKPFAFMQLEKVFFELLRDFDFEVMDPAHPWESVNYGLYLERHFWVRVARSAAME